MTAAGKPLAKDYWRRKTLPEMSSAEWEALCDGCGKCCLLKLEDEETEQVHYTCVACRLFDPDTCRCGSYELRRQLVPQCVVLSPENIHEIAAWMPATCAYRLLAEGQDLPWWHPLVTGDPASTRKEGMSVKDMTVPEYEVAEDDIEDYVIRGILE